MKARSAVAGLSLVLAACVAGACVDESSSEEATGAGNGGEGAAAEASGGSAGTTTDAVGGAAGSEHAGTAGGGASGAQPGGGAGAGGASDVGSGGAAHAGGGGSAGTAVSDAGSSGVSSEAGRGGAGGGGASSDAGRGGDGGVAQTAGGGGGAGAPAGGGGGAGAPAGGDGGAAPSESCGQGNACSPEGASCTVTVIWCEAPAWDQPCVCNNGSWLCATGGIPEDCHECCQDAHDEGWFCVWGQCLEAAACTATDCCVPGPDGDAYCAAEFGDCSTCQVNSDQDGGVCTPTEC